MEQQVFNWITAHGYPAIFLLLVTGIVGLPVPDETLLAFTGFLVYKGNLKLAPAFLAAFGGSVCGITLSYVLGRWFGMALLHRYGKYLHLTEERIAKAHDWFERLGRWALTFGYYIPGVRHLTAYAAGMSGLEPHVFAVFAYAGAFIWTASFITLGYLVGERWEAVVLTAERHTLVVALIAAALAGAFWLWRKRRGSPPPR